jgi:hypothetical protein
MASLIEPTNYRPPYSSWPIEENEIMRDYYAEQRPGSFPKTNSGVRLLLVK